MISDGAKAISLQDDSPLRGQAKNEFGFLMVSAVHRQLPAGRQISLSLLNISQVALHSRQSNKQERVSITGGQSLFVVARCPRQIPALRTQEAGHLRKRCNTYRSLSPQLSESSLKAFNCILSSPLLSKLCCDSKRVS